MLKTRQRVATKFLAFIFLILLNYLFVETTKLSKTFLLIRVSITVHYESDSGFGELPAGFELSSGNGINSLLSLGGRIILPCFQSSFACSMRSLREETKFHQIKRSPK